MLTLLKINKIYQSNREIGGGDSPPSTLFLYTSLIVICFLLLSASSCGDSSSGNSRTEGEERYEVFHDLKEWQGEGIIALKSVKDGDNYRATVVILRPDGSNEMTLFQVRDIIDENAIVLGTMGVVRGKNLLLFAAYEKTITTPNLWRFQNNRIERVTRDGANTNFYINQKGDKIFQDCFASDFNHVEKDGDSPYSLCKRDITGDNLTEIFYDPSLPLVEPHPNPEDETKLITYKLTYSPDIYLVDLKIKKASLLIKNGVSPQWSPDGKYIAFLRPVGNFLERDLWVATADGTGEKRLTDTGGRVGNYVWDSKRPGVLLFHQHGYKIGSDGYPTSVNIYMINRDGRDLNEITKLEDGVNYYSVWAGELGG